MSENNAATEEVKGEEVVESATVNEEQQLEEVLDEEPKKKTGFARRAEKMRRQQEELQNEVQYWKNVALQNKSTQPAEQTEPTLDQFDNIQDFIKARDNWLEEKLVAKISGTVSKQTAQSKALDVHNARVQLAKKELTDWDDVFEEVNDLDVAPDTAQFIIESDAGPKLAYYLAKHPSEVIRLNNLSPLKRIAELGKLEDKVMVKVASKKTSNAPEPLPNVKGGSDLASTGKPKSYAEWKANRVR